MKKLILLFVLTFTCGLTNAQTNSDSNEETTPKKETFEQGINKSFTDINKGGKFLKQSANAQIASVCLLCGGCTLIGVGSAKRSEKKAMGNGLIVGGSILSFGAVISELCSISYKRKAGKVLLKVSPTYIVIQY